MNIKTRIEQYRERIESVSNFIKLDLKKYIEDIDLNNPTNEIQILNLMCEEDIYKAIYGQGFYIILTSEPFEKNKCRFIFKNKKAIYRGHSVYVKKRLLSHLANERYKKQRKKKRSKLHSMHKN